MLDYRAETVPELQQSKTQWDSFCALSDMPLWGHEKTWVGRRKALKWECFISHTCTQLSVMFHTNDNKPGWREQRLMLFTFCFTSSYSSQSLFTSLSIYPAFYISLLLIHSCIQLSNIQLFPPSFYSLIYPFIIHYSIHNSTHLSPLHPHSCNQSIYHTLSCSIINLSFFLLSMHLSISFSIFSILHIYPTLSFIQKKILCNLFSCECTQPTLWIYI